MSDQVAPLITQAEALARVADQLSASYALELSRVLRDLERRLRVLIAEAQAGSSTALARAVRAAKIRRELQTALSAAGFDQLATTATSSALDRLVAQMEQLRGAAKLAAFTTSDQSRILALQRLANIDVLSAGQELGTALWRTVAQGLFSQRPLDDILTDLADVVDVEESRLRTLYDTAISVFTRQVEAMKSTPDDVFAYLGPVDQKLRPFCRAHVGKVYTRAEIDALDNGQLPNVFLTGGGYNCRHVFQAVSKLSTLRELVDTDQRIPEIEDAIRSLPAGGRKAA